MSDQGPWVTKTILELEERVAELTEEIEHLQDSLIRQGKRLSAIVNITKGQPKGNTLHSTHDAVESVERLQARVVELNGLIETKQGRWVTLDINVPWRLTGLNKKTMRRVDGEPVAEVAQVGGSPVVFWDKSLPVGTKLYTHTDSGGNQAVSVPEWIKCSDRMPAERCLMFTDNDGLGVMYRIIPAGLVNSASEGTHWMPLPKPPKQEQDHE